jgi:CheY-like chemotaxis protein
MDCQMPELDGMEATGEIRRIEALTGRHVPVIAMTAHAMQGDREKCIAAGMDDYISKPVTAAKLNEVLSRWLPRSTSDTSQQNLPSANDLVVPAFFGHKRSESKKWDDSQPPPINWQGLQQSCGEDGALEILRIFVDSSRVILQRLEVAIEAKDAGALKAAAHELKGATASVGSLNMSSVCKKLEEMAKDKSINFIQAGELFKELKGLFDIVISFSQRILVIPK